MTQKGYENVYLISGGIETFLMEYPEFVEGKKVPILPKADKKYKIVYKRSNYLEPSETGDVKITNTHVKDDNDHQSQNSQSTVRSGTVRSHSTSFKKSPNSVMSTSKTSLATSTKKKQ